MGSETDKQDAITNLTNPLITSINFPSEIISTLANLAPSNQALELIHKFLLTRLPDESTPETDLHLYTISLAASQSVSSAFSFIRSLPTEKQGSLRDGIWAWAFGAPRIPCGLPQGKVSVNQIAIKEILHLPLLPAEDDHLLQFLLSPPRLSSQSLSLLHDLVTLRLIHRGKYAESLQLDKELAGSGGSEESRQKRREMVREFIAILPEAQRRALTVDGEYVSSRREGNTNGYMEIDAPKATHSAPTPIKQIPTFPLEPTETPISIPTPKAATPIPPSRVVSSTNSPFSGPPRFASTSNNQVNSPQIARVLSGSPFTLPMSRGANAVRSASSSGMRTPTMSSRELPIPRPKVRPAIQDEEERGGRKTRKRARESDVDMNMDQGSEQEQEQESVQIDGPGERENADTEMEISKEDVEPEHEQEQEQEPEQEQEEPQAEPVLEKQPTPPAPTPRTRRTKPPPPPPEASATPKRTTRNSTLPPPSPLHARIPGSFDLSIPQSVPEDKALQSKPRPRKTKTQTKEAEPPRSRMTRSVSRAISLDMEASPPVAAKRARSRRGSTATVASVAEEESSRSRASPTPSTRSRVGSQTPRKSTRTRK